MTTIDVLGMSENYEPRNKDEELLELDCVDLLFPSDDILNEEIATEFVEGFEDPRGNPDCWKVNVTTEVLRIFNAKMRILIERDTDGHVTFRCVDYEEVQESTIERGERMTVYSSGYIFQLVYLQSEAPRVYGRQLKDWEIENLLSPNQVVISTEREDNDNDKKDGKLVDDFIGNEMNCFIQHITGIATFCSETLLEQVPGNNGAQPGADKNGNQSFLCSIQDSFSIDESNKMDNDLNMAENISQMEKSIVGCNKEITDSGISSVDSLIEAIKNEVENKQQLSNDIDMVSPEEMHKEQVCDNLETLVRANQKDVQGNIDPIDELHSGDVVNEKTETENKLIENGDQDKEETAVPEAPDYEESAGSKNETKFHANTHGEVALVVPPQKEQGISAKFQPMEVVDAHLPHSDGPSVNGDKKTSVLAAQEPSPRRYSKRQRAEVSYREAKMYKKRKNQ